MNSSLKRFLKTRERLIHTSVAFIQKEVELHPSIEAGGITLPAVTMPMWVTDRAQSQGTRAIGRNAQKRRARGG